MELKFIYSRVYFENLNKYKKSGRDWDEVIQIGRNFEKKYSSQIKQVIEVIPKVIGRGWNREFIEVYIVNWEGPSFSLPFTLNVREDRLLMLVILTHELLHQFDNEDYYLNEKESEERINKYVEKVFEIIDLDVKTQIEKLKLFCSARFEKVKSEN